jgi:hypothetical protein
MHTLLAAPLGAIVHGGAVPLLSFEELTPPTRRAKIVVRRCAQCPASERDARGRAEHS